jgi:hypothetical protein
VRASPPRYGPLRIHNFRVYLITLDGRGCVLVANYKRPAYGRSNTA